jgi:hypothetical protein
MWARGSKQKAIYAKTNKNRNIKMESTVNKAINYICIAVLSALIAQPAHAVNPRIRHDAMLYMGIAPELGPVWVEVSKSSFWESEKIVGIRPARHDSIISSQDWSVCSERSGDPIGCFEWKNKKVWFAPSNKILMPQPVETIAVAERVTSEAKAGYKIFGIGIKGIWRSTRYVWPSPTKLDALVEREVVQAENETRESFLESVRRNAPLKYIGTVIPISMIWRLSGDWSYEREQIIEHRGKRAVSVLNWIRKDTGGAHGTHYAYGITAVNGPEGYEKLIFENLFQEGLDWKPALRLLILNDLRRQGASWVWALEGTNQPAQLPNDGRSTINVPEHVLDCQQPVQKLSEDELADLVFTANVNGVAIYFLPYEAGSWAEGTYVVELPWEIIRKWVRTEVYELFLENQEFRELSRCSSLDAL